MTANLRGESEHCRWWSARVREAAFVALVVAGIAGEAAAGVDFQPFVPLAPSRAAADGDASDMLPVVETDGAGVWIAAWASQDPAAGVPLGDEAVVVSRSIDDGETWSLPVQVIPPAGPISNASRPSIANDGNGVWVVVATTDFSILSSTSIDHGATWRPVVEVMDQDFTNEFVPFLATDGAGVWLVAWSSGDSLGGTIGEDYDVLSSRSLDDGQTWSEPVVVDPVTATSDGPGWDDYANDLAVDASGNWLLAWDATFGDVMVARSVDGGQTWAPPVQVGAVFPGSYGSRDARLAADSSGNWVVAWDADLGEVIDGPDVIWTSRSTDGGATWSAQEQVHPSLAIVGGANYSASPFVLDGGLLGVAWESYHDGSSRSLGRRYHPLVSYSRDGGQTWSSPAGLVTRPRGLRIDQFPPAVLSSPTGRTVVVQSSGDSLGGTIGEDWDVFVATSQRDCPLAPRTDCRTTTSVGGSILKLRDKVGGADRLTWRLRFVEATSEADLGDPLLSDSYALCLYELVLGAPGLVSEWDAPAGGTCNGLPCWRVDPGRVVMSDRSLARGSVLQLEVASGPDGRASVHASVGGPALAPPRLPLDAGAPVHMQLINTGTGVCWEGVHDQAKRNDSESFVSVSD